MYSIFNASQKGYLYVTSQRDTYLPGLEDFHNDAPLDSNSRLIDLAFIARTV